MPPVAPVIVAGVTGTDREATELMRAVIALPNGALVLPALDHALDDESWALIDGHPEHPQFGLKKLMDALGLSRADVRPLSKHERSPGERARWLLACEAMRPAATTERWHRFTAAADKREMAAALIGMCTVEAATAEEEAEAVALMLREAAESPGRTATLITPDRALARRWRRGLEVWGIAVEDAAGLPFGRTLPGVLLDLVVSTAEKDFEPVALMTLLKHSLCRAGMAAGDVRRAISTLELAAFRAPYFGKGLEGVEAALEGAETKSWRPAAVRRLQDADWQAARQLLKRLAAIFVPMERAFASIKPASLHTLARCISPPPKPSPKPATPMTAARSAKARPASGQHSFCQPDRQDHARPRSGGARLPRFLSHAGGSEGHPLAPAEQARPERLLAEPARGDHPVAGDDHAAAVTPVHGATSCCGAGCGNRCDVYSFDVTSS
ncbi:MAG: hypothetical protein HC868_15150 [Sphingomonadales bacterium]|nr:hypothetical protein [Sphingomonadales bacterium]